MKKRINMPTIAVFALVSMTKLFAQEGKSTQTVDWSAVDSPYAFKLGFPADEKTIKQAQDATDLRRAIEAYKFFVPTVATEAVIQHFKPHGAVPNKAGIIMPQDPEQQFSVANQDTPYVISVFNLKDGPIVIEVPEGLYMGLMDDHHMEWFGDMGVI